jgi:hypothetical protein
MSINRYARKRDLAEPEIVGALQAAGFQVWRDLPVDLLVRDPKWLQGVFRCLEVKTPGLGTHESERERQTEFIRVTGTPIVKTPVEALQAVGEL